VHQSGGAVDIESALGEGTTIHLYLPVATDAVADQRVDLHEPHEERGVGRVLVVEDDIEVADVAAALLQHYGYSVKLVHRAEAALDLVQSGERVDLVFSDVIMPGGMNGVQLAEEVRRRFPKLPILLTTGYSDAMASANENGLAVIIKPYRGEDLRKRIEELLRSNRGAVESFKVLE
jgi:CheY-like chemotaxis protein